MPVPYENGTDRKSEWSHQPYGKDCLKPRTLEGLAAREHGCADEEGVATDHGPTLDAHLGRGVDAPLLSAQPKYLPRLGRTDAGTPDDEADQSARHRGIENCREEAHTSNHVKGWAYSGHGDVCSHPAVVSEGEEFEQIHVEESNRPQSVEKCGIKGPIRPLGEVVAQSPKDEGHSTDEKA